MIKMATGALFGGSTSTRPQSKNLVEFRAGKMTLKGKMVTADKRKGFLYVYQSDDALMHFCWKDRTSGQVEDDLIIFPDDIEFKHVPQCTTGRVYLLKFKSSSRKFFFWMQEPKSDKDEEYCKKVNDSLNNPPAPGSNRAAGGGAGGPGGLGNLPPELAASLGDSDLQSILGNMSQQQLMQLLGGMGMGGGGGGMSGLSALMGGQRPASAQSTESLPARVQSSPGPRVTAASTPATEQRPATAAVLPSQPSSVITPATPAGAQPPAASTSAPARTDSASADQRIQLSDLQNILSGISVPEQKDQVDLGASLNPDTMIPILANPEVQERLVPFLPEGESLPKTEGELKATVKSPQFQQALGVFSQALASGQLGPLMKQFGLGDDAANAAAAGDVEAFVKAMQAQEQAKKDGGEEKMDTD
ncbi:unnamed protein product [Owenia fusiformis]|uniref:Uncharacterized protein n=1 Tax=Owenia fusiformis TaxID=6347 RepID=A0A8J1TRQ0_OWEFU|nr:unnamed protein product [Owenia fusiformis]